MLARFTTRVGTANPGSTFAATVQTMPGARIPLEARKLTRRSGSVSGIMATFGSLGGAASPVVTVFIADKLGWSYALDFAALVTVVSGLSWFFIHAGSSFE